ncbi:hypothetical protein [Streptomyces scabichelini]|uniref:hypothetical protein n=1 Tax=Streptomyces scabichelini TaxID=2711217 RepID=UPI001F49DC0B|nr:hypothetical protein [Streptomyces scabichelini]
MAPAPRALSGVLIVESLRVGSELNGIPLQVTAIHRIAVGNATADRRLVRRLQHHDRGLRRLRRPRLPLPAR